MKFLLVKCVIKKKKKLTPRVSRERELTRDLCNYHSSLYFIGFYVYKFRKSFLTVTCILRITLSTDKMLRSCQKNGRSDHIFPKCHGNGEQSYSETGENL